MNQQTETFYYHDYCTGHGFQREIDEDWENCPQCGDISSRYLFSFDNQEEFIARHMENYCIEIMGIDTTVLTEKELKERLGEEFLEDIQIQAKSIYVELLSEVYPS